MRFRKDRFIAKSTSSIRDLLQSSCSFFNEDNPINPWLDNGLISIEGRTVTSSQEIVHPGNVIILKTPESWEPPVNKEYKIIFQDKHILAVDKPAPLPVHRTGKYWFHTLSQCLVDDGFLDDHNIHPTHRLDRETSGIVLFAKDKQSASSIQQQFQDRTVHKEYIAICHGVPGKRESSITFPLIKRDTGNIRNVMTVSDNGLRAITRYNTHLVNNTKSYSLLTLVPETGRRHQLRAHLFALGHPIVGDKLYGPYRQSYGRFVRLQEESEKEILEKLGSSRQLLHCRSITITHPNTLEKMTFTCNIPADMNNFCHTHSIREPEIICNNHSTREIRHRTPKNF
ncbi:MAG: RluA family pseudouridine synthase [Nanoarchaeota archaeon]